jgi:hypothetical protein
MIDPEGQARPSPILLNFEDVDPIVIAVGQYVTREGLSCCSEHGSARQDSPHFVNESSFFKFPDIQ